MLNAHFQRFQFLSVKSMTIPTALGKYSKDDSTAPRLRFPAVTALFREPIGQWTGAFSVCTWQPATELANKFKTREDRASP